jgi:dTMP kinase
LPVAQIDSLVAIVHPDRWPDLTVLLDLPADAGLARASTRNGVDGPDRFESEQRDFFERVRHSYLERARGEPGRFRIIDASAAIGVVEAQVRTALEALLGAGR